MTPSKMPRPRLRLRKREEGRRFGSYGPLSGNWRYTAPEVAS